MQFILEKPLSQVFNEFVRSEKAGGLVLIACTAASLLIANSPFGPSYVEIWHMMVAGLSVQHWVNDALMAVFFLLIGLELERELYDGELSEFRDALLPISAAAGGVALPALIHLFLNQGTATQAGIGIPMATDIAFALAVLALVGSRVPASLKVFLVALAVIDDLVAIVVIALFYTSDVRGAFLLGSLSMLAVMAVLNWRYRVQALIPYLVLGALMWFFTLKSGVHATIAGVLLAFVIPYKAKEHGGASASFRLEHVLHRPVAFVVLPLFALANTAIVLNPGWVSSLASANSLGIMLGLLLGKPIGIVGMSFVAVALGFARLPLDLSSRHIAGAGLLGGIGFTMSIFIANLAFPEDPALIDSSKMAIICVSVVAGLVGFAWLSVFGRPQGIDSDMQTMDFRDEDSVGGGSTRER